MVFQSLLTWLNPKCQVRKLLARTREHRRTRLTRECLQERDMPAQRALGIRQNNAGVGCTVGAASQNIDTFSLFGFGTESQRN